MIRKLLFATFVVLGIITVLGSLVGCDKKNPITGPTEVAPPVATTPPLPPGQCWEEKADNRGGPLPCTYPPEGEVRIGLPVGFRETAPGQGVSAIPLPKPGYPGRVEVRIQINEPGPHLIKLTLGNPNGNKFIRSVTETVTGSGSISLPFDGTTDIQPFATNADSTGMISGQASFWYLKDQ